MNKWLSIVLVVVLALGTIANGVLYFQASEELDEAQSQIVELQSGQSSLEADLSTVEENVSSIDSSVSSLETGLSGVQSDITGISGQVSDTQSSLSDVQEQVSTIEGDVSTVQDDLSDLDELYATLDDVLAALENTVTSVESDVSGLEEEVQENATDLSELAASVEPSVVMLLVNMDGSWYVGSGVIITSDGWILTAAHMLDGADTIKILLSDGTIYYGEGTYYLDDTVDAGLVKIASTKTNFTTATLGSSSELEVGDQILVVGYPLGLEGGSSTSAGIVSAVRICSDYDGLEYIQTDAAINGGNSGGPMVNTDGEVVGIVSWHYTFSLDDDGNVVAAIEGMNFAVPINDIKALIEEVTGLSL